jgi:hypothetical protein
MESTTFFAMVFCKSSSLNNTNHSHIDDIFIASTNATDIPVTDLQEITLEIVNDPQQPASRRNHLKHIIQSPIDRDTPNAQATTTGPLTIDVKKSVNVRDSGFLDDEDVQSGRDSELASSRPLNNKQNETISEDAHTSNDILNRKLKSKIQNKNDLFLKTFLFYRNTI